VAELGQLQPHCGLVESLRSEGSFFEPNVLAEWASDEFGAADPGGARLRSDLSCSRID